MTTSFHDVELLSAYLDGKLSPPEVSRLETRLKADPDLRSVMDDLRQTRALLRQLPQRRAPRNFTLTPKMAGIKPPVPRAFPFFQFASAFTALLFFFTFAFNVSAPAITAYRASNPPMAYGKGGGGGGDGSDMAAAEAPALAAAPAAESVEMTATPETLRVGQAAPTAEASLPDQSLAPEPSIQVIPLPISPLVLYLLLGVAVVLGGTGFMIRARAEQNWYKTHAAIPAAPDKNQTLWLVLAVALVLALAAGIYWLSTTTFYATIPQSPVANFSAGKGGTTAGDKGGSQMSSFPVTLDMGYNFSFADNAGYVIALDFDAGTFGSDTLVTFNNQTGTGMVPGLPDGYLYAGRLFQVMIDPVAPVLKPYTITVYYSDADIANIADEKSLVLMTPGQVDAASTCAPAGTYERFPEQNMLRVTVCAADTFVLAGSAP
jgi:hypothetical protein